MGINAIEAALLVVVSHLKSAALKLCFCVRGGRQRLTRHPPNRQDLHKQNENFNQDLHTSDDEIEWTLFSDMHGHAACARRDKKAPGQTVERREED